MMRTAKKPSNSNTTERNLPGSIVLTARTEKTTSNPNATHVRPGPLGANTLAFLSSNGQLQFMVHRGGFEPP